MTSGDSHPFCLQVGFTGQRQDALTTRQACIALTQLSAMPDRPTHQAMQQVYKSLAWVLLSDSVPDSTWFTAAEAAVTALYALHPAPQELAQVTVQRLGKLALQGSNSQAESGAIAWPRSTHDLSPSWTCGSWVKFSGKFTMCLPASLSSKPTACWQ